MILETQLSSELSELNITSNSFSTICGRSPAYISNVLTGNKQIADPEIREMLDLTRECRELVADVKAAMKLDIPVDFRNGGLIKKLLEQRRELKAERFFSVCVSGQWFKRVDPACGMYVSGQNRATIMTEPVARRVAELLRGAGERQAEVRRNTFRPTADSGDVVFNIAEVWPGVSVEQ